MEPDAVKVVTDIEKPGTTPAHATSRPIITSRAPAVKDPMVSDDAAKTSAEPARFAPSVTKKKIVPLETNNDSVTKAAPTASETEAPSEPAEETPLPELTQQDVDDAAAAAQVALSKEEQQQAELVAKLTEQKKYFVPIGAVSRRRTARVTLLLSIVLVMLAVGGVMAIDAGIIETNITLPFDLIK